MAGGINADKWAISKNGYDIVPEVYDEGEMNAIFAENEMHREVDGWSKEKHIRKLGSIPMSLIYNYCWANGIPNHCINDWLREKNGANIMKLLDEFPKLKTVSEQLSKKGKKK